MNSASWASQTVANHYVMLREIPAGNIFELDWTGSIDTIDVELFRQKILGPVLIQIERRGLAGQIDAIVYSSDFPTAINMGGDLGKQQPPQQLSPVASITSATYLWQMTMSKNPNVIGLRNNQYARAYGDRKVDPPTHGFHSWYGWGPNGELIEAGGTHYMLSTMLAITSGRGNSVAEAVGYLRRAAHADGSDPKGTIYFCENNDVRSTTRAAGFPSAVEELKKLGVAAQIVRGTLPSNKPDVAGLMVGAKDFSWPSAQSTILPGAICEHLTSFGGMLGESAGQTPLTEFLRYGAAGASGTVVEPYAIQDKFPLPAVQIHYARGSALAEAFYQSVIGPYQLLIVGDPLCQPWAKIPRVTVEGLKAGDKVSGKVNLRATATVDGGVCDRFELFVDGRHTARRPAGTSLPWDTTKYTDGYNELRVVAIEESAIETQGRVVLPVMVDNVGQKVEFVDPPSEATWDEKLKLKIKAPSMSGGLLFFNGLLLGKFEGEEGEVELSPRKLGSGSVMLYAIGTTRDKPPRLPTSAPLELNVTPGRPLPALSKPRSGQLVRGLRLKLANGKTVPVQETQAADWLSVAGVKAGEAFALEGFFDAPVVDKRTVEASAADVAAQGVRQFQLRYTGDVKLAVDSALLYEGKEGKDEQLYVPVALAPGLHRLRVSGRAGSDVKLQIRYGGLGTRSLDGVTFRHSD